jgi:lipid-A-disaccharide synthase
MRVMISCGEPSGDLYAGALAEALRARDPGIDIFGFGGSRFAAAGGRLIGDFAGLSVTGLTEAIRVLPQSLKMLRRLVDAARELKPDVFVPIDFPDFNFRLMASLRRLGMPVVYYISPQLWAWRPARMKTMKQHVDKVLVIFPFEEAIYRDAGVPAEFVGHPLVDLTRVTQSRDSLLREHALDPAAPTVALLPGSRRNELQRIAPTMAEALPRIQARVPGVQFVVAAAPNLSADLFEPLVGPPEGGPYDEQERGDPRSLWDVGAPFRRPIIVRGETDNVLAACDVAITASGTATVQCALHERPMVVVYRLSSLTYMLGKPFVKVDTYAMANLVAGTRVVPELIQDDFTPDRVADETITLLTDRERYESTRRALATVRHRLGEPGASGRAADAVLAIARRGAKSA